MAIALLTLDGLNAEEVFDLSADHDATRWQVDLLGGDFSAPLVDSGWDTVNLTRYVTPDVLEEEVMYQARGRVRDELYVQSEWSYPVTFRVGGRIRNLYLGTTDAVLRGDSGVVDRSLPYSARIVSGEIAPAGMGGEAMYTALYVVLGNILAQTVVLTPILDGRELTPISIDLPARARHTVQTFEVALSELYAPGALYGVRGTWLGVRIDVDDLADTNVEVHGVEAETEIVQESFPNTGFTAEDFAQGTLSSPFQTFLGGAANMMKWPSTTQDDGEVITARIGTSEFAFAGAGGECEFCYAYVLVAHLSAAPFTLRLTPVVDGVSLEAVDLDFDAAPTPICQIIEVSLSQPYLVNAVEVARYNSRGSWIGFELQTVGALPAGLVYVAPIEVEHEIVRESMEAVNGTA